MDYAVARRTVFMIYHGDIQEQLEAITRNIEATAQTLPYQVLQVRDDDGGVIISSVIAIIANSVVKDAPNITPEQWARYNEVYKTQRATRPQVTGKRNEGTFHLYVSDDTAEALERFGEVAEASGLYARHGKTWNYRMLISMAITHCYETLPH